MMKTVLIASAVLLGASTPTASFEDGPLATADQAMIALPATDSVVAQFSYLEISHDEKGFGFAISDKSEVFLDFEFAGDFHIRIGI